MILSINCFSVTLLNKEVLSENLAHETNPKIAENRSQLMQAVKENNADLGILWDGDGDRAYFIDKDGKINGLF